MNGKNLDPKKVIVFLIKTTKPGLKIDQKEVSNDKILLGEISEQTKAKNSTKYVHTYEDLFLPHLISKKPENIKKTFGSMQDE